MRARGFNFCLRSILESMCIFSLAYYSTIHCFQNLANFLPLSMPLCAFSVKRHGMGKSWLLRWCVNNRWNSWKSKFACKSTLGGCRHPDGNYKILWSARELAGNMLVDLGYDTTLSRGPPYTWVAHALHVTNEPSVKQCACCKKKLILVICIPAL